MLIVSEWDVHQSDRDVVFISQHDFNHVVLFTWHGSPPETRICTQEKLDDDDDQMFHFALILCWWTQTDNLFRSVIGTFKAEQNKMWESKTNWLPHRFCLILSGCIFLWSHLQSTLRSIRHVWTPTQQTPRVLRTWPQRTHTHTHTRTHTHTLLQVVINVLLCEYLRHWTGLGRDTVFIMMSSIKRL